VSSSHQFGPTGRSAASTAELKPMIGRRRYQLALRLNTWHNPQHHDSEARWYTRWILQNEYFTAEVIERIQRDT
jgi:hypothetical protein